MKADFQSIPQQTISFAQSRRTVTVPITIVNDTFPETNETFGTSLGSPVVQVGSAEHTLTDDEAARIQIQPETATVEIQDNDGKHVHLLYPPISYDLTAHVTSSSSRNYILSSALW